jgi:hypothetical protein
VKFNTAQGQEFEIELEYGPPRISAEEYFPLILREENPADRLAGLAPDMAAAIRDKTIVVGMGRAETAMARGFPPFHQTAGIDAPTWFYYDDQDIGQYVTFTDDRVTEIRTAQTP